MYQRLKGAIAAYARAYIRTRSAPYRTQTPIRDLIPSPPLDRSGLRRRTSTHPAREAVLSSPQIAFFPAPHVCISVCKEPLLRTLGRTSEPEALRIEPRHRFETSSHHLPSTGQPRIGAIEAVGCPDASRRSSAARTRQRSCCGGGEEVSARSRRSATSCSTLRDASTQQHSCQAVELGPPECWISARRRGSPLPLPLYLSQQLERYCSRCLVFLQVDPELPELPIHRMPRTCRSISSQSGACRQGTSGP